MLLAVEEEVLLAVEEVLLAVEEVLLAEEEVLLAVVEEEGSLKRQECSERCSRRPGEPASPGSP